MIDRKNNGAKQDAEVAIYRATEAGKALTALGNNATQQGALGPAASIALDYPAFQPKLTGKLLILSYMHITDTIGGDLVTFQVKVDNVVVDEIDANSTVPGSHDCAASMHSIVQVDPTTTHDISIVATAGAGNIASVNKHQRLSVVELPA